MADSDIDDVFTGVMPMAGARVAIPLDELLGHRWFRLRKYLETFEAQVRRDGAGDPGDYVVVVTLESTIAR